MTASDLLRQRAQALRLYGLLAHWNDIIDAPWLPPLLQWEEEEHLRRSLERRLKGAQLGRFKALAEFDWKWPKRCDRGAVEALMTIDFLKEAANVILIGPNGVGKTTLAKALARAIEILAEAVAADFAPPPPPFPPDAADKREHEKASRRNAERAAREVFGRRTRPRAVTGTRDPRDDEAAAARRLTRALREATAGGRDKVTTTSKVPPGRLRMGKALAGKAQRAAGAVPTAEPFTHTRSRRVPAPPLRVGIACDISGSMGAFAGPVASAAWILARAAGHLPSAVTASVLFGKGVYALTRPGERPAQVTDFTATASSESACRAIDALDGALDLAGTGTARLLVIVSDTWFVAPGEPAGAQQRITRLHRAGCGVIILTPKGWAGLCKYTDCQVIEAGDPADAIDAIARAATRALTA